MTMQISEEGYRIIFNHSPIAKLILKADSPRFTILDVNEVYLEATNTTREGLIGQSVFAAFPKNPTDTESNNIENTIASFNEAIATGIPHTMVKYRYDIPIPGTTKFEKRFWTTTNTPITDQEGNVSFLIHAPIDVTENYKLEKREKASFNALKIQRRQLFHLFMQAPVGIGIFKGPKFIVDLINPEFCQIFGRSSKEIHGQPLLEMFSQAVTNGLEELLERVRTTGESYEGKGKEISIVRSGIREKVYLNFSCLPFYEDDNSISGIIIVASDVTTQVTSMHLLAEAEERARLAADAVDLGTYDLNILSAQIVTSQRFADIFGFDQPASQEEYASVLHPEDLSTRMKAHEDAIEKGIMMYEARIILKDETIRWIRVEGKVLYDKDNNPVRLIGTVLDITDAKRDKEEQKKLITLVANSADLMAILDLNDQTTYMNEAGLSLLGFQSPEQALLLPLLTSVGEEDYRYIKETVKPAVELYGRWTGKLKVKNIDTDELFSVFSQFIRIDDQINNQPIAIGVVMRDLRPEIRAKQALADSEHLLKNITSASPTALWMANERGEVTYVNQTWVDWSRQSFEDNLGSGWSRVVYFEDQLEVVERFKFSIHNRTLYETEFRIQQPDESFNWYVALGQPQYKKDGSFAGFIGSCTDITEHKELQAQKDNFIGIASHELKTPVTSLKGYTQVLQRVLQKKGYELEAGMMQKMDAQLDRLTNLIRDLLDVTKINSGRLQINEEVFELGPLISDICEDLQRTTQKHALELDFHTSGRVYADKDRIEQVIINLLTNAIKYTPHEGSIYVHCSEVADQIVVCVQDSGVGIAKENHFKIFEQFYRVTGEMQHTFPGMGLGLYISSEIIKRAGGRIWVESVENQGSSFYFSLPAAK